MNCPRAPLFVVLMLAACARPDPVVESSTYALTTGAFTARIIRMNVRPSCKRIAELEFRRADGSPIAVTRVAASNGSTGDATAIFWPSGAYRPGGNYPTDWVQFETVSQTNTTIHAIHFVVLNSCTSSLPVIFSFDAASVSNPSYPEDFVSVQADTTGQTSANEIIDLTDFSTNDYQCASAPEGTNLVMPCPAGQVISDIPFATWGDAPQGTCQNPLKAPCALFAMDRLTARCLGHASCTVLADDITMGRDYELCGSARMHASYVCTPGSETTAAPGDRTARWLKLHMRNTEGDDWGRYGLAEVRFYDDQNQSLHPVVVDQSSTDHTSPEYFYASHVLDGNPETLWAQGQNGYPADSFLTFDFGTEVTLGRVELDNLHDGYHAVHDALVEDIQEIRIELKKPGVPLWTVLPQTVIAEQIVRIDLASKTVTAPNQNPMTEVEVITQSSQYYATGKYSARATLDGSEHSGWSSATTGAASEFIIYDLGGQGHVDRIWLDNFHTSGTVIQVAVEVSTTGLMPQDFTTAVPAFVIPRDFIDITVNQPARYVKLSLTGHGVSGRYMSLAEVEFFGTVTLDPGHSGFHLLGQGRVEAEDYAQVSGIAFEPASEGGLNAAWLNPGDQIQWNVTAPGGDMYFVARVAAPSPGAFRILLDGIEIQTVSVPNTGGGQTWQDVLSSAFHLSSGNHQLTLEVISSFHLNWLEFHDASLDECAQDLDDCAPEAVCTDDPFLWSCTCLPGYAGDGTSCTDVDECALNTDNCAPTASCTNTPGSFTCACPAGWRGDGTVCQRTTLPSVTGTEQYFGRHAFRWNSYYPRHLGDYNWDFTMSADKTYVISFEDPITADTSHNPGSINPYLYLHDPVTGDILAEDDRGNGGLKSKIVFTPSQSGPYSIGKASAFATYPQTRQGWGHLKIMEYVDETPNFMMTNQQFAWDPTTSRSEDGPDNPYNYRVRLKAGVTYTIETQDTVADSGSTGTTDTYLYLFHEATGDVVAEDDDSAGNGASKIRYEAQVDGIYVIKLRAKAWNTSGRATLSFSRSISINECQLGTAQCDPNATCIDTPESYSCTCNSGFDGDGATCQPVVCGDGLAMPAEDCDGADLNQTTCSALGFFGGGILSCATDCTFDTSQCQAGPPPMCGHWAEQERNDDGTPSQGAYLTGNDFSTEYANGPIVSCDATVQLSFDECGDEDVFRVTNDQVQPQTFSFWTQNHPDYYYCVSQEIRIHVRDEAGQTLATYADNCTSLSYTLAPQQTVYLHVVTKWDSTCWGLDYYLRVDFP